MGKENSHEFVDESDKENVQGDTKSRAAYTCESNPSVLKGAGRRVKVTGKRQTNRVISRNGSGSVEVPPRVNTRRGLRKMATQASADTPGVPKCVQRTTTAMGEGHISGMISGSAPGSVVVPEGAGRSGRWRRGAVSTSGNTSGALEGGGRKGAKRGVGESRVSASGERVIRAHDSGEASEKDRAVSQCRRSKRLAETKRSVPRWRS
ncbi:unnamed protein product [Choristocarpus tenellus]